MSELYTLENTPPAPQLTGTAIVRRDVDTMVDALAADLFIHAHNCVRTFGDFHLALSGGSTPIALYRRLMIDPQYRDLPWSRTHLWIVDERRVPFDDERSNYKMINEFLGDHSGIPPEQVHPMFALADDADEQYQATLREVLGWREKGHDRLDFVLLGMGGDGHTASLFPQSPALLDTLEGRSTELVRINAGPKVTPPDRVTMTLPLINASRFIAVMVSGEGKRAALERVQASVRKTAKAETAATLPILGVVPVGGGAGGELRWYLDQAACPVVDGHS